MVGAEPNDILCGKYRVERELARGGMGIVVLATHLKLERQVAIKLLVTEGKDRAYLAARFLREARAAGGLVGENVVRILDLDEAPDGTPFLVMELLDGLDLERLLLAEGKVAVPRAVDWALQACAALAEAHARGIVHRDVKPANLLLLRRLDGSELIKLLDFGISKIITDEVQLTRTAATLGSPLFMSPEQLLTPGSVDQRSDVWSLGVTLYRLLAGTAPFDAGDASTLAAQIAARPPTPLGDVAPALPPALVAVVMRCLEKDASQRYPSVVAVAEALEPFRAAGASGSLERVLLAQAQGKLVRPGPVAAPVAAGPAPSWTLSHDVPRAAAPGPVVASSPIAPTFAATPKPRRGGLAIFLGLLGVGLALGFPLFSSTFSDASVVEPSPPAKRVEPPTIALPTQGDVPVDPPLPVERAFDAGVVARVRPVKTFVDGPRDPAELELK